MVKLTKIYTRSGDDGRTMLGSGARVPKEDLRVEAYGTVDEANAFLGAAVLACEPSLPSIAGTLRTLQHDLFDVGADLCTPIEPEEAPGSRLRVQAAQTKALEDLIDKHNADLSPLNSFVLPGGSGASCSLHVARTVTRRAERLVSALLALEPEETNAESMRYLNRLSDLLFVLARVANNKGASDVLWEPGKNRRT